MRKLARAIARAGRNSDVWPVALLLFAVLVPAVCLLWFMNAAMRNERLAAQQKLADSYRAQLAAGQTRLEDAWQKITGEIEEVARTGPAPVVFAKVVEAGVADSVVLFDEHGRLVYPNAPSASAVDFNEADSTWSQANWLEYRQRNFLGAAELYHQLGAQATNAIAAARALQAEARCLVRAGETNAAVRLVGEAFADERYRDVPDAQGRLIAAERQINRLDGR